ncbi:hypothetical protein D3C87_1852800 [compost metagenome]
MPSFRFLARQIVGFEQHRVSGANTGLFLQFAQGRLFRRLTRLGAPARKGVHVGRWRVGAPHQEITTIAFENDGGGEFGLLRHDGINFDRYR